METLIIILIVVMIAQTVLFIYNDIIDKAARKQALVFQEQVKNAQIDFAKEISQKGLSLLCDIDKKIKV